MKRRPFGIFDVDTRQARDSGGWTFMPRALPYRDGIDRLITAAKQHHVPTIFTTCERGNMLGKERFTALHEDILFVPLADNDQEWLPQVGKFKTFFVEKKFSRPDFPNNVPHSPYEIFLNNQNANRLIDALGIDEWIVFGNAMDVCGHLVISNFISKKCKIYYIPELMIPGSACINCNPDAFKNDVYDNWHDMDASPMELEEIFTKIAA